MKRKECCGADDNLHFNINVTHMTDRNGSSIDITCRCKICGGAVTFVGPEIGVSPNAPMVSLDRTEIRLPALLDGETFEPGAGFVLRARPGGLLDA